MAGTAYCTRQSLPIVFNRCRWRRSTQPTFNGANPLPTESRDSRRRATSILRSFSSVRAKDVRQTDLSAQESGARGGNSPWQVTDRRAVWHHMTRKSENSFSPSLSLIKFWFYPLLKLSYWLWARENTSDQSARKNKQNEGKRQKKKTWVNDIHKRIIIKKYKNRKTEHEKEKKARRRREFRAHDSCCYFPPWTLLRLTNAVSLIIHKLCMNLRIFWHEENIFQYGRYLEDSLTTFVQT